MKAAIIEAISSYRSEILAVLSFVAAFVFFIKGRRSKGLSYCIETDQLLEFRRGAWGLEIFYCSKKIESFSVSRIYVWNRGSEAIRHTDIAPSAPLVINVRDPETILQHFDVYCSSPHSRVSTKSRGEGSVLVEFDYLDPKSGAQLLVLHTGGPGVISFSGAVIGGGEARQELNRRASRLNLVLPMAVVLSSSLVGFHHLATVFGVLSIWTAVWAGIGAALMGYLVAKYRYVGWMPLRRPMVEKLSKGAYERLERKSAPAAGE